MGEFWLKLNCIVSFIHWINLFLNFTMPQSMLYSLDHVLLTFTTHRIVFSIVWKEVESKTELNNFTISISTHRSKAFVKLSGTLLAVIRESAYLYNIYTVTMIGPSTVCMGYWTVFFYIFTVRSFLLYPAHF